MLPPTPPWEGLHPLVIHFPIALLLVSALFVFLGAIFPARGWWLRCTALILLALGTASAFVAVRTGEYARDVVEEGSDTVFQTLDKHEELGEKTRNAFAALTVVYAILIGLPLRWKQLSQTSVHVPLHLVFLAVLMAGNLLMANAAHLGGRLVHEFGVHSALGGEPSKPAESKPAESEPAQSKPADATQGSESEVKPSTAPSNQ